MTWPPFEEDQTLVAITKCVRTNRRKRTITYDTEWRAIPGRFGFRVGDTFDLGREIARAVRVRVDKQLREQILGPKNER